MSEDLALIPASALERGDVLLSKAYGAYAEMICMYDKCEYSHAAIWSGHQVIEAVPHAVVERALASSVNQTERQWVHLFRWREPDRGFTADLIDRLERYVGEPYALINVLFIAHAAITAPAGSDFRANLPKLIAELREYEQLGERVGFTCAELIARCFYESGHALDLPVANTDPVRSASRPHGQDPLLLELLALCERIAARDQSSRNDPMRSNLPPFHVVSPGDLSRSASLYLVGKLDLSPEVLQFKNSGPKPKPRARATATQTAGTAAKMQPARSNTAREQRSKQPEKLLYIALAADGRAALDSEGEYTAIRAAILQSKHRDQLQVCAPELGSTALRAANALDWEQPTYVHVAGHADTHGMAALGGALDVEHLLATLGKHAERVRVVVLNACHTAPLAQKLSEHIDVVIGMRGEIRDTAAKAFAEAFYLGLGNGRSLADAFHLARGQLRQRQGEDLAQLEAARVDPEKLWLTPVPRQRSRASWWLAGLAGLVLVGAIPMVLGTATHPPPLAADVSSVLAELRISEQAASGAVPITAQTPLRKGAKLRLELRPRRDAFLYVIHLSPRGKASLLYASQSQPLAAGSQLILPDSGAYELDDEIGEETISVIASEGNIESVSPKHANIIRSVEREQRLSDAARLIVEAPAPQPLSAAAATPAASHQYGNTRGFSNLPTAVALRGDNGVAIASVQLHHIP